jgi:hypothetical protein
MNEIRIFTGTYAERQEAANEWPATVYIEIHANSVDNSDVDYAMTVVASNHSNTSYRLAQFYAEQFGAAYDVGGDDDTDIGYEDGVRVGGRGDGNLRRTDMPAVLLEPGFGSNPAQARLMETDRGLDTAARIILAGVERFWPDGAKVALSIGHKGSKPGRNDMGARWRGTRFAWEAEWAEAVANRVVSIATAVDPAPYEVTEGRRFVGPVAVNMRAYPDWRDRGFCVVPAGSPVNPVRRLDGEEYTDGNFGVFRHDGFTGWLPLTHIV